MADAWSDLVRGFDGVDPPLDLLQRVREHEARSQGTRHGLRAPRAARRALAAAGVACVVGALALAAHSRRDEPPAAPPAAVASPEKLATLRTSFASPPYHPVSLASAVAGIRGLPIPLPRPNSALASDRTLDSVSVNRRSAVLIWKSGIVETIEPWHCNCTVASFFSGFPSGFKRYRIGGAPAVAHSSDPTVFSFEPYGLLSLATRKYGVPASVEAVRGGFKVTLWEYGAGTLPGLLEVARTLPANAGFAQIIDDPRAVITGGTREQQRLLRSIMRGIDSNDVPKVEIGSPPASWGSTRGIWLTFRLSGLRNHSQLGIWEMWLAAGAFRELSRSRGLPAVYGFGRSFADSIPGREETSTFPADTSHPTSGIDSVALAATIENNLAKAGLSLVSLRFARPFHLAPIVIARTDDPAARQTGWRPKGYPVADDSQLEGSFFEVVDAAGKVVYYVAHSTRTQTGMSSAGVRRSVFG
jgi:hypothetical protein